MGDDRTVMLVEDDPAVLAMFDLMLRTLDWQVLTARDGRDALDQVTQTHPRIAALLTDYLMPHVDGLELVRRLRRVDGYRDLPVLMITAIPLDDSRLSECEGLGVTVVAKTDAAQRAALSAALAKLIDAD